MQKKKLRFTNSTVEYYFSAEFSFLKELADSGNAVIITDENVFASHPNKFRGWKTIIIKAGEKHKTQKTVDRVINQLIDLQAGRNTILIGAGGGVVTDLTGYLASIYMRGVSFGFVPTSLLAMVDASIGGKNGIDVGVYKNMVGTIRQPQFILYDLSFLKSLPELEWQNGFAEIIKHASIRDAAMFKELENRDLDFYSKKIDELALLIQRNALLKTKLVQKDEFENGDRKLLNFGHTLGHALENQYALSHGHAISIGMAYASKLSEILAGFRNAERVISVLKRYGLPVTKKFDREKVVGVLMMDKKREKNSVNLILLETIGKAVIRQVSISDITETI